MISIKDDDKFFSRLLSKESSTLNQSFRDNYRGNNSEGVPFVWEVKPGTPKHPKQKISDSQDHEKKYVRPLTPPPSYYINHAKKLSCDKKSNKPALQGLFPRMVHKRQNSSTSVSSTSTFSSFSTSSPVSDQSRKDRTLSNSGSLFDLFVNGGGGEEELEDGVDDDHEDMESPKSVMCFRFVGSRKIRSGLVDDSKMFENRKSS